jgi:alkylresorcinol/alkylpyrone synthase
MTSRPALLSLATAVPPYLLRQKDVAEAAGRAFASGFREYGKIANLFESTGVEERHAVRPFDWYVEPRGWPERTAAYLEGATTLFEEAARAAMDDAQLSGDEIDAVVVVSSTGIAIPSLDSRMLDRLGLRSDVARVPVFGLGCAAGVTGLALASKLAAAEPGKTVLLVAVELCTLAVRLDKFTIANVVSTALFADGAAAAVIRSGEGGLAAVSGSGEHTWRDTLGIMGFDTDPQGLGVVLDRAVAPFAETHLGPAVAGILDRLDIDPASIGRYICHPGGPKVVLALERVLGLAEGTLDAERAVLRTHGNMSAPTALFVLKEVLRAGLPPRSLLLAMGPGFTLSCVALERLA